MKQPKANQEAEKMLISRAESCTDENMGLRLTSDMSKEEVRKTLVNARNRLRDNLRKS